MNVISKSYAQALCLCESLILCRLSIVQEVYFIATPEDILWTRDKFFRSQKGKKISQYLFFITTPISITIADL